MIDLYEDINFLLESNLDKEDIKDRNFVENNKKNVNKVDYLMMKFDKNYRRRRRKTTNALHGAGMAATTANSIHSIYKINHYKDRLKALKIPERAKKMYDSTNTHLSYSDWLIHEKDRLKNLIKIHSVSTAASLAGTGVLASSYYLNNKSPKKRLKEDIEYLLEDFDYYNENFFNLKKSKLPIHNDKDFYPSVKQKINLSYNDKVKIIKDIMKNGKKLIVTTGKSNRHYLFMYSPEYEIDGKHYDYYNQLYINDKFIGVKEMTNVEFKFLIENIDDKIYYDYFKGNIYDVNTHLYNL